MKLSLFSVSYAGYWGQQQLGICEFIAKASELGYDAVMLAGKRPHLSPLEASDEQISQIKNALASHKIECAAMAGYTDLGGKVAAEVPYLEMQIANIEALCRIGAEIGAHIVRVFTAYEVEGVSPHTTWSQVVSALKEICDRAHFYGVTIAVQNHHDIGVHSDALLELLHDVDRPNCKVGFDAWSPALRGEDLYEAALRMAPHTAITTNADYIRLPRFRYEPDIINYERVTPDLVKAVKFGEGFIDYPSFFRGLQEGGFNGIANYEMCSPVRGGGDAQNLDDYSSHYLQWMRQQTG